MGGSREEREPGPVEEASAEELRRRVYHLKTLYDLSQEIGFLKGTDEIAGTLLAMVMGTFGSLSGIVVLVDTEKGCLHTLSRRGLDEEVEGRLCGCLDVDGLGELRSCDRIELLGGDGGSEGRRFLQVLADFEVRVWAPFTVDRTLVGGIGLGEKILGDPYGLDDQELLYTLANQGAVAMENARFIEQMRRDEIVRTNLSRYLSPQIVQRVMSHDFELNLGGKRKAVTILFSDIRDFTGIAEQRPPDELVSVLNQYFTAMANCVFEHHGVIDKFIGDAIMAVFGGLIDVESPSLSAARAAVEMMEILPGLNETWQRHYGGFSMKVGVGITSGDVFVGNIGSPERMEYTAIGDAVNVASRFSGLARAGQVLVDRRTMEGLGDEFALKAHPPLPVKGKSGKMEVFEILY